MNESLDALGRALAENPADPRAIAAIATTLRGLDRVAEAVLPLQHCAISIPLVLQPTLHIALAELHAPRANPTQPLLLKPDTESKHDADRCVRVVSAGVKPPARWAECIPT